MLELTVTECEHTRLLQAYQQHIVEHLQRPQAWPNTFFLAGVRLSWVTEAATCPELYGNLTGPALTSSAPNGIDCNKGITGRLETQEVHSCKIFPLGGLFDGI